MDDFRCNAPQFVDFSKELEKQNDDLDVESYFEVDHEAERADEVKADFIDDGEHDIEQEFFSPLQSPFPSTAAVNRLRKRLRRSLSAGSLPMKKEDAVEHLSNEVQHMSIGKKDPIRKKSYIPHCTIAQSPALLTKLRARPTNLLPTEQQEVEEAKKFKIRARPVNTRILYGPVKAQAPVERRVPTKPEPFKLTDIKKPETVNLIEEPVFKFHAKPVPKSVLEPPKQPVKHAMKVGPPPPKLSNQWSKRSRDNVDKCGKANAETNGRKTNTIPEPFKPIQTQPAPFSFEQRDKEAMKRKKELFEKIIEEERQAREFRARPLPKNIFRSPQKSSSLHGSKSGSHDSLMSNRSDGGNQNMTFRARPPTVLYKEPFVPKKVEQPLTEITAFELNTDRRAREREAFEQHMKQKEEQIAEFRKKAEAEKRRLEQLEIARLRKEAEHKAQPIRHYKRVPIIESKLVTVPMSPNFASKELARNKEN